MSDTYDRHGPRDRRLRVGDAEREAVADILRAQYVAGRLDSGEFEGRLERCLAAFAAAREQVEGVHAEADRDLAPAGEPPSLPRPPSHSSAHT